MALFSLRDAICISTWCVGVIGIELLLPFKYFYIIIKDSYIGWSVDLSILTISWMVILAWLKLENDYKELEAIENEKLQ